MVPVFLTGSSFRLLSWFYTSTPRGATRSWLPSIPVISWSEWLSSLQLFWTLLFLVYHGKFIVFHSRVLIVLFTVTASPSVSSGLRRLPIPQPIILNRRNPRFAYLSVIPVVSYTWYSVGVLRFPLTRSFFITREQDKGLNSIKKLQLWWLISCPVLGSSFWDVV